MIRNISSAGRISLIVFLWFGLFTRSAASGQTLKVDVVLQEVTSTVTDSDGKLITDLRPEDFIVELDGVPQKIEHFSHGKNVPISIGLILDASRSMETTISALKGSAESFVAGMYPEDESFIVAFDMKATIIQDFTHDRERLFKVLQTVNVGGSSGLIRGVAQARKKMAQAQNPKHALIVISDGGDSFSGEREIAGFEEQLDGVDVLIYPVQIQDLDEINTIGKIARQTAASVDGVHGTPAAFRPDLAKQLMESMASESAGKYFYIKMSSLPDLLSRQLSRTFEDIFTELRGQYTIGFYPGSDEPINKRLRVRTVNPNYHVRTSALHSQQPDEADPDPYATALLTADSARRRGETAEAMRALEHATILKPSDPRAFRQLAGLYVAQGHFQQALDALTKVQSLSALNGADHLAFGTALMELGDPSDAQAHFVQSLKLNPENAQIYLQLYNVYMHQGKSADALAVLDDYLNRFPDDAGRDAAIERADKLRILLKAN